MARQSSSGEITARLIDHVVGLRYEMLPAEVVIRAKQVILDTFGALLAGSQLPPGKLMAKFISEMHGKEECTVAGSRVKAPIIDAAWANGAIGHADEVDDSHFASLNHPATCIIPAALAIGERYGGNGKTIIAAVVAGYDVQCRLSLTLEPKEMQSLGRYPMSTCGTFGAVTAAAKLLEFNARESEDALGLAALQAWGLFAAHNEPEHLAKSLQPGFAARNGVTAALLTRAGFHGPPHIFEGARNVIDALSPNGKPAELTKALGSYYEIMGTSIKKYACGGPIRGPVDGLLQIMEERKLTGDDIAEIIVKLPPTAIRVVGGDDMPSISLHYVVAVAAYDRRVDVEQTHSETRTTDSKVLDLKKRVRLVADQSLEEAWPAIRASMTEVVTKDGRMFSVRVDHARGSPGNPMSQEEVEGKFRRLAEPVVGKARVAETIAVTRELEKCGNIGELAKLLRL